MTTKTTPGLRVLVCGGRDYTDRAEVDKMLFALDATHGPISVVIHGGASGADTLAHRWVRAMIAAGSKMEEQEYRADWKQYYGIAAGPIRNRIMLVEGKPDLVIAFPGGRGTKNMTELARRAGVKVIEVGATP